MFARVSEALAAGLILRSVLCLVKVYTKRTLRLFKIFGRQLAIILL